MAVVIASAVRTAITNFQGGFTPLSAPQLGAFAVVPHRHLGDAGKNLLDKRVYLPVLEPLGNPPMDLSFGGIKVENYRSVFERTNARVYRPPLVGDEDDVTCRHKRGWHLAVVQR